MAAYRLKIRNGPRVERTRFDSLQTALAELESSGRALEQGVGAKPVELPLLKRFEPVQQVRVRLELAGPRGLRGGVDVRGDGSSEAWTGRFRRTLVDQRRGESAYDALRRTLA